MSKNIYLAGKLDESEDSIQSFATELEAIGHKITYKWWLKPALQKPYLDNYESSNSAAYDMLAAAYGSDIFILFPTDNILGAAIEFGAAIASKPVIKSKEIIVVNPYDVRQSVFYAHPFVVVVRGLQAVREREWF